MNVPAPKKRMNPLQASEPQAHIVLAATQLLRVLRRRRLHVIACLVLAITLGAIYYASAPRLYRAQTSLMLTYRGNDDTPAGIDNYRQGILPTYERLFQSSVVLESAASALAKTPDDMKIDVAEVPRSDWVDVLRGNVSARAIRATNFIEVSYTSKSPVAAVASIDAIVEAHLDFVEESQKSVALEFAAILKRGRLEVAKELEEKSKKLLQLKSHVRDLGLRSRSEVVHPLVQNVIRINDSLSAARELRLRLEATLNALGEAVDDGGDVRHFVASIQGDDSGNVTLRTLGLSTQDEEAINEIDKSLRRDRLRLQSMLKHYGEAHPSIRELKLAIRASEEQLRRYRYDKSQRFDASQNRALGQQLITATQGKLTRARAHELSLHREFQAAQKKAVQINGQVAEIEIVEHDIKMLRELHDTLRNRVANLDMTQDQPEVSLSIVSAAKPIEQPVSPRFLIVVVASLFGGLAAGIAVAYIRDVLDDRFASVEELRDQLDAPILSVVRRLETHANVGLDAIQVHLAPTSVASEAFRSLRTTLAFSDADGCVVITSSEPGDGKTTVLSNLGVAFAHAGKRTLLIDADMRRPGLTKLFQKRGNEGLSDILSGEGDVHLQAQQLIQPSELAGLDVLPSGLSPADPSAHLISARFGKLVTWAQREYDQVIIDTPPVLAATDALIVGKLLGGLVLVVQPSKNNRRLVLRAADEIRGAGLSTIGVVVNRVTDDSEMGYGYGYGYGYHADAEEVCESSSEIVEIEPEHTTMRQAA